MVLIDISVVPGLVELHRGRLARLDRANPFINAVIDEASFDKLAGFIDGAKKGKGAKIIAGGTPTFTVHALNKEVDCSPGTCLLWDYGYDQLLAEQPFEFAAILMTRIISKPARGLITTDLGHKSVAAENPISKRIFFLNLSDYEVRSQSEEHLVVEVKDWENLHVGDVLYGVPYHICPTVALYDEAVIVENGNVVDKWNVVARKKKITI